MLKYKTDSDSVDHSRVSKYTSSSAVTDEHVRCAAPPQTAKFYNDHATLWHPVARIRIAYLCTKSSDFRFSRFSGMIGTPKIFNGSHDLTTPLSGRFVVRRL